MTSDLFSQGLSPAGAAENSAGGEAGARRGRPRGARNKRSSDLRRWIEATFDGQTPGQQAAQACMVTPKELRQAKAAAKALGLVELGLSPMMLALVVKAQALARALGCEPKEAWLLLAKERAELHPYIHQKLPAAEPAKPGEGVVDVLMIPDGPPATAAQLGFDPTLPPEDDDADDMTFIEGSSRPV